MENEISNSSPKNEDDANQPPQADDSSSATEIPTWLAVAAGLLIVVVMFGIVIYVDNQMPHSDEVWNRSNYCAVGGQCRINDKLTIINRTTCDFDLNGDGTFNVSCD